MSKIEWTERTWNPIVGCSIVSPGCTNCYAMKMAARLEKMLPPEQRGENILPNHYSALTKPTKAGPVWTGRVNIAPDHIRLEPLRRKKPTMWFVNSMGDLFHENVPDEWILKVLDVVRSTSHDGGANCGAIRNSDRTEGQHVYQVLTKRSARMRDVMRRLCWDGERLYLAEDDSRARIILHNLWLGVSCEDQKRYDERKADLRATPAAVHFFSFEPLLGPIVGDYFGEWAIVGGESGRDARPMHPDWARALRDQCLAAGVPFFFKQWGEWAPTSSIDTYSHGPGGGNRAYPNSSGVCWLRDGRILLRDFSVAVHADRIRRGVAHNTRAIEIDAVAQAEFHEVMNDSTKFPGDPNPLGLQWMYCVGKKRAGRLLDGREWNDMPAVVKRVAEVA